MPKCGAKTRSGGKCQRDALRGQKRCAIHGGKSTGPKDKAAMRGNKRAASPGSLYSQFLTEEEKVIAASLELGSVDEELRLTRIRLMRVLAREEEFGGTLELYETIERTGGGDYSPGDEEKKRERDYNALVDKLTARIESLELRRVQILAIQADTALKIGRNKREGEMHKLDAGLKHLELKGKQDAGKDDGPVGKIVIEVVGSQHARNPDDHDGAAG
ncbi:HGGxSTG domain-containing protein [Chromobacterium violaceum]|uniref:HGGxSTG domain-containing protein n=1 Tax=Chromobacterium violaceum TaxID=536 RepID=UPI001B2FE734|nr:HGGxSTG domain-containing protein [Chromobacterium violaceum]